MGDASPPRLLAGLRRAARAAGLTSFLRRVLRPVLPHLERASQMHRTLAAGRAVGQVRRASGGPAVCYLNADFPAAPPRRSEFAFGGAVKTTYLSERFPHSYPHANLLYAVSSVHHPAAPAIVRRARERGLRVVLNQNGVYYRAWFGPGWEPYNRPLAAVHRAADFIVYQSDFCRQSAERFLGAPTGGHCVLPNPVDLSHYTPGEGSSAGGLVLLVGAVPPARAIRMEAAVKTLARLVHAGLRVRLLIPGYDARRPADAWMMARVHGWADDADVPRESIEFSPPYTRLEAPEVFRRAHLLLHPVYNDPSPNVVGEALACGLPVVYSASGGVPELVGAEAGVGVPAPLDWEVYHAPDAAALAGAVQEVAGALGVYAAAARCRAEQMFDLDRYLNRHARVFEELLGT